MKWRLNAVWDIDKYLMIIYSHVASGFNDDPGWISITGDRGNYWGCIMGTGHGYKKLFDLLRILTEHNTSDITHRTQEHPDILGLVYKEEE